jgi:hypothetical protein
VATGVAWPRAGPAVSSSSPLGEEAICVNKQSGAYIQDNNTDKQVIKTRQVLVKLQLSITCFIQSFSIFDYLAIFRELYLAFALPYLQPQLFSTVSVVLKVFVFTNLLQTFSLSVFPFNEICNQVYYCLEHCLTIPLQRVG